RATEAGMRAGLAIAEAGVTENKIAAEISRGMFTAGGEYPAVMPYVASGPRTMIGHATWEGRELQPGESVFLEVGGCYRRYHTAMMRTVLLHEMTPVMHTAQELMKLALADLRQVLRPGLTVADADSIVRNVISDNGIGAQLVTRAGYSIGIAFPPSWDEGYIVSLNPGDFTVIEEGMTFHVIPWMWGVEGTRTVGISDTLQITHDGCESFFDLAEDFTIKGGPATSGTADDRKSGLSAV
ncbi:MAG: Xaa-Pro peptidase family protein, partial [Brachybacterium sp.]|nr:Xaa-Pro peptidase family protein [Brachybacterium sp.]